jgi:hypothetical protein
MRLAGAESTHGVSLRPAKGKNFFFEKKKQKTFASPAVPAVRTA